MNADPVVMEHYPALLTSDESNSFVDRIEQSFTDRGWGLWAVEVVESGSFAGYVGLWPANFEAHFTPAVEIVWRLDHRYWNHGYATEGARAALKDGFASFGFEETVSFTAVTNVRSQRVMQKLGMAHNPADDSPRSERHRAIGPVVRCPDRNRARSCQEIRFRKPMLRMMDERFTPDWRNPDACRAAHDKHNAEVRATIPANRLIEWQPSDGGEPICAKLGVPVPSVPFPHVNTTDDFRVMLGLEPTG